MDKGIKDCDDAIGDLALLNTNNKTDLVSAINEQNNNLANKLTNTSGIAQSPYGTLRVDGVNVDDLVHTGFYYCSGVSATLNYPTNQNCYMTVIAGTSLGGYVLQELTPINADIIYRRRQYNGSWTSWKSLNLS